MEGPPTRESFNATFVGTHPAEFRPCSLFSTIAVVSESSFLSRGLLEKLKEKCLRLFIGDEEAITRGRKM